MPIRFRCAHCHTLLSITTRKTKTRARCPTCCRDVPVPVAPPAERTPALNKALCAEPTLPPLAEASPPLKGLPPSALPVPRRPRFRPRRYAAFAGLVAAVLFFGVAALAALSEGTPDDEETSVASSKTDTASDGHTSPQPGVKSVEGQPLPPPEQPSKAKPRPDATVLPSKADKAIARPERIKNRAAKAEAPPLPPRPVAKAAPPKVETPKHVKPPRRLPALVMKRRQPLGDEELRKQLLDAPQVALDAVPNTTSILILLARKADQDRQAYSGHVTLVAKRADLASLPLRMGKDCHLGKEPAEALQILSRKLRTQLQASIPKDEGDIRPNADKLRLLLLGDQRGEWLKSEAVPALMQLLQAENTPLRALLIELLGQIKGRAASEALALRAATDLDAEVREQAVRELKIRPSQEFSHVLLEMLRYPWAPVAEHAAEALATLEVRDTLPEVIKMLAGPDPSLFTYIPSGKQSYPVARELVRINHLGNCVLCHAPSTDRNDLVRGAMPKAGEPLPAPLTSPQYYDSGGIFVRADITYLKQDFAVMQPVESPNRWPSYQRFDYVVRQRPLDNVQVEAFLRKQRQQKKPSPQRQAMLFVLREMTGKDHGSRAADWLIVLPSEKRPKLSWSPGKEKN